MLQQSVRIETATPECRLETTLFGGADEIVSPSSFAPRGVCCWRVCSESATTPGICWPSNEHIFGLRNIREILGDRLDLNSDVY